MGITSVSLDQSFGQENSTVTLVTYTNDTEKKRKLSAITLHLGTWNSNGAAFPYDGSTLEGHIGSGDSIDVTLCINSNSTYSATKTVDKQVGTTSYGYPNKDECTPCRFEFSNPYTVNPGDSVNIVWTNRASMTSSKEQAGQILTVGPSYLYTDEEVEETVTVTYDANGGSIGGETKTTRTVAYGGNAPDLEATRDGYTFAGWYNTATGNVVANLNNITKSITVYAHWTQTPYVWRYNSSKDANGNVIGWEKVLFVKKFNGTSWDNLSVHSNNSGWN